MAKSFEIIVSDDQVDAFVARGQELIDDYMKDKFPSLPREFLIIEKGRRYARIVKTNHIDRNEASTCSAWAFIDLTNGDILKPATYKAPAKHARGNINDDAQGMKHVDSYGPAYLK